MIELQQRINAILLIIVIIIAAEGVAKRRMDFSLSTNQDASLKNCTTFHCECCVEKIFSTKKDTMDIESLKASSL